VIHTGFGVDICYLADDCPSFSFLRSVGETGEKFRPSVNKGIEFVANDVQCDVIPENIAINLQSNIAPYVENRTDSFNVQVCHVEFHSLTQYLSHGSITMDSIPVDY
jgi:hypothetical protein